MKNSSNFSTVGKFETLERRSMMTVSPITPDADVSDVTDDISAEIRHLDVNNDDEVTPLDAMIVINDLNNGTGAHDVNGDGESTPADALAVINYLNEQAENEASNRSPNTASIGYWYDTAMGIQEGRYGDFELYTVENTGANDDVLTGATLEISSFELLESVQITVTNRDKNQYAISEPIPVNGSTVQIPINDVPFGRNEEVRVYITGKAKDGTQGQTIERITITELGVHSGVIALDDVELPRFWQPKEIQAQYEPERSVEFGCTAEKTICILRNNVATAINLLWETSGEDGTYEYFVDGTFFGRRIIRDGAVNIDEEVEWSNDRIEPGTHTITVHDNGIERGNLLENIIVPRSFDLEILSTDAVDQVLAKLAEEDEETVEES